MPQQSFKRSERLKSRKIIGQLFSDGQSFGKYPIRLVWLEVESSLSESTIQVTFSVPKRKFKKAVERNRLKRQMREAYRLNKHQLYEAFQETEKQYAWMLIYVGKEKFPYKSIEKSIQILMHRFIKKIKNQHSQPKP